LPRAQTQLDIWQQEAERDRQKLAPHLGGDAKNEAIKQSCTYAPDMNACAARIGDAYEYLVSNKYATLTIASGNKAVSLPAMAPAGSMPSYYDVYQVYAFLTRAAR